MAGKKTTSKKEQSNNEEYKEEYSHQNLKFLAKQLAINHFNSSTIDLFPELEKDDQKLQAQRYERTNTIGNSIVFKYAHQEGKENIKNPRGYCSRINKNTVEPRNTFYRVKRNVLVIGAGCSYNAFKNIPLGAQTIKQLKREITIARYKKKGISFEYFIEFYKCFDPKMKLAEYLESNRSLENEKAGVFLDKNKQANVFLDEQLREEFSLLAEIAKKYSYELRRWELILLDDLEGQVDFETFLHILEQILPKATVREALQRIYGITEGVTKFYSLISHLFKNRFIDVIINFNFDELLDRAIEEELGENGYDRIISDGDCVPIKEISMNARLRQPLYIKPHGTASHKSTLRFTKDHYHELPSDMRVFMSDLISCAQEDPGRPLNLITMGFDMNSIEFNEILTTNLNPGSSIFNIFFHGKGEDFTTVGQKKQAHMEKIFSSLPEELKPDIFLIGSEFYERGIFDFAGKKEYDKVSSEYCSLGNLAQILFDQTVSFFNQVYEPRPVYGHQILCDIFGNRFFWNLPAVEDEQEWQDFIEKTAPKNPEDWKPSDSVSYYSREYFNSAEYFKDRVLINIFIYLTFNSGNFDLTHFINGPSGYYYSRYVKKKGEDAKSLDELLRHLGIVNTESNLQSYHLRSIQYGKGKSQNDIEQNSTSENLEESPRVVLSVINHFIGLVRQNKDKICSEALSAYFDFLLKEKNEHLVKIKNNFINIWKSDNSRILSDFRNYEYYSFKDYRSSDLINTYLLNDLNFHLGLDSKNPRNVEAICMVADNGFQLAKFLSKIIEKYRIRKSSFKVYLIIQDQFNGERSYDDLKEMAFKILEYSYSNNTKENRRKIKLLKESILNILVLPIKDHNHHMTLFLDKYSPGPTADKEKVEVSRAIYYYKRGLSQKINPIKLDVEQNQEYLFKMFKYYSEKANRYVKELPPHKDENGEEKELEKIDWITKLE